MVISVVNDRLMGNHQLELARFSYRHLRSPYHISHHPFLSNHPILRKMEESGHIVAAKSPQYLLRALQSDQLHMLAPWPDPEPWRFASVVQEELDKS